MEILKKLAEKVKALTVNDLIHELSESPEFNDLIIELNTRSQLYERGIDSRGRSLGDYAANTIEGTKFYKGKKEKGQRFDHITLNDTGEFYESFKVTIDTGFDIIIDADTIKDTIDLLDAYGEDILGLTEESLKTLREKALEILIPYIKNVLLQV